MATKRKRNKIDPLSQRQIDLIFSACRRIDKPSHFNYFLYHTVFALFLFMGLNEREVMALTLADMPQKADRFTYNGRDLPIPPELKKLLRRYHAYRAARAWDTDAYLIQPEGRKSGTYGITLATLHKMFVEVSELSRVKFDAQSLRDTFLYNLAIDGAPLGILMRCGNIRYEEAQRFFALAFPHMTVDEHYVRSVESRMRLVRRP